jgi:transposase-like protein
VTRVARQLGIGPESGRLLVRHAEVDDGRRASVVSESTSGMKLLDRENRDLHQADEILGSASPLGGIIEWRIRSGNIR